MGGKDEALKKKKKVVGVKKEIAAKGLAPGRWTGCLWPMVSVTSASAALTFHDRRQPRRQF